MKDIPTTPSDTWFQGLDFPSRLFESGSTDYERYEEDGEFLLSDDESGGNSGLHRRFPKTVTYEDITAEYTNGVLTARLAIENQIARGEPIEVQG